MLILQYLEDKARIKDAMKLRKVQICHLCCFHILLIFFLHQTLWFGMLQIVLSSTWTLEDFKAAISEDITSPLSDTNLKVCFFSHYSLVVSFHSYWGCLLVLFLDHWAIHESKILHLLIKHFRGNDVVSQIYNVAFECDLVLKIYILQTW